MACSDGTTYTYPLAIVSASSLAAYSYSPWMGPSQLDTDIAQTLVLGSFVLGAPSNNNFVISGRTATSPGFFVSASFSVAGLPGLALPVSCVKLEFSSHLWGHGSTFAGGC